MVLSIKSGVGGAGYELKCIREDLVHMQGVLCPLFSQHSILSVKANEDMSTDVEHLKMQFIFSLLKFFFKVRSSIFLNIL